VFLDLKGKCVIVVGDGNAALWKLELLARAGARVRYICKQPTPELLDLLSNNALDVSVETNSWRQTDFASAIVIVADVEESEAEEFFLCARATTSMVNIVDRPAFCTFQFGSIVNKSPLVIGISTSGIGPVLAQHVRSLIETVLPANLQHRLQQAAAIRTRVNQRLSGSLKRREYWNAFYAKCFGFAVARTGDKQKAHVIRAAKVESLTIENIRSLQMANHVYYCIGTDEGILRYARREAVRIAVKADGLAACSNDYPPNTVIIVPAAHVH
jgi:uroporphyrin-III C-methyltransferase/precorrin-2 dehydrogenase/sirohydrochlorin ferrochelatase